MPAALDIGVASRSAVPLLGAGEDTISRRSEYPASRSSSVETEPEAERRPAQRRGARAPRIVAVGFMQLVSLVGVVGLAVILGAVLVDSAKLAGWVVGLVIGAGSVILTMLVLFSGRHARRH